MKHIHVLVAFSMLLFYVHLNVSTYVQSFWRENDYALQNFCNVTSSSYSAVSANKSLIQCAVFCSRNESCAGYTYSNDSSCSLFASNLWNHNCSFIEDNNSSFSAFVKTATRYWEPQCLNGASLTATNTCVCVDGWIGDRCNNLMEDCTAGKIVANYTEDKVYWVKPSLAPKKFKVKCQMSGEFGMTQMQLKVSDNATFNKTWQEFKDGFDFSPQKDYWLGNDNIHHITASKPHTMVISIVIGNTTHQRYFYDFVMANETEDYAVTYREAFTNMSLAWHLESCWGNESIRFSTYDRDNDGMDSINCASEFGAGWWYQYSNCTECNPNGDLYPNEVQVIENAPLYLQGPSNPTGQIAE
ncbi:fibrinogen 1-like protein [Plakobranchus ocellatus]|uniref:Fibrinogen 1-like protein n=1 Tax=Plakobranchus ocellatus TaxID=259542 RepID=A0AAV4D379_9GAST|nr:fibrinogen 1-like protein [Plakobranchus ocellatus]